MSSLNTLTGRNGTIGIGNLAIARITQWAVNPTLATSSEWGDSDSGGYTNRATGRRDATFTCEGKYDSADEVFDVIAEGDVIDAALWLSDAVSGLYWDFPRALCTDFNLTVNVDSEEIIGWTSSFGTDGQYYRPGETVTDPAGHAAHSAPT